MATFSCEMSFTINMTSDEIDYAKITARISDVDMEQPIKTQLGNFDEVADKAFEMLKTKLKKKIKAAKNI